MLEILDTYSCELRQREHGRAVLRDSTPFSNIKGLTAGFYVDMVVHILKTSVFNFIPKDYDLLPLQYCCLGTT